MEVDDPDIVMKDAPAVETTVLPGALTLLQRLGPSATPYLSPGIPMEVDDPDIVMKVAHSLAFSFSRQSASDGATACFPDLLVIAAILERVDAMQLLVGVPSHHSCQETIPA
ncbi:hypothetical protein C0991_010757 [Blastosporella zonata]|nr:hypothetical protein C0991_010757 [Blastosporella zonata]